VEGFLRVRKLTKQQRDLFIAENLDVIDSVIRRFHAPRCADSGDLWGLLIETALKAVRDWEPKRAPLNGYVRQRLWWAALDWGRKAGPMPRQVMHGAAMPSPAKSARRPMLRIGAGQGAIFDVSDNRGVEAEEICAAREAMAALQCLPEVQRVAVRLTAVQGLTQRQAARKLGVSVGTVGMDVHRGLARLRKRLLDKEDRRGRAL